MYRGWRNQKPNLCTLITTSKMEDQDDDFGELYADVEVQVSAAINAIPSSKQCYGEAEDKNEDSNPTEAIRSDSASMEAHAPRENGLEAESEKGLILDNGSDSDDGLNIVLNEEDCPMNRITYGAHVGNRGTAEGSDEDDDLVIVTEANTSSKDRKLVDQMQMLTDGLEQSSVHGSERGNGTKGGYHTQYSQYKYIRSYGAIYPSNNKINGSGSTVSFPSSLLGRGDWDSNASNRPLRSSSGLVASSGTATFLMAAQSGCEFSLPRNRTIFDVNIESIDPKPWRHAGIDISDFFNFCLDEESWKEYCNCLEQFRQQGSVLTKCLRPYQVNETECGKDSVAEEIAQMQERERISPVIKNADTRRLELPKGRAIQVEGGIGERQPSMDVRRPRNRDSDAVIQIFVQDASELSIGSSKEEPGYTNDSVLEASENGGSGMDLDQNAHSARFVDVLSRKLEVSPVKDTGLYPLARCSRSEDASSALSLDPDNQVPDDECHHQKLKEQAFEEPSGTVEMIQDTMVEANKNPFKVDRYKLEAEASLGDHIQHSSSLSYSDSHSMSQKAGVDTDKEETCNPTKQSSSDSVNGLKESSMPYSCHTKGIASNDSKKERGDCRNDFGNQNPMQGKKEGSKLRLRSVAEVKIHVNDDGTTTRSDRKGWYDGNHLTQSHVKQREEQFDFDFDFYDTEQISHHRESKMSIDHQSERYTKKHVRNAFGEFFYKKAPLKVETDSYPRRPWREGDCFLDKRTSRDIKVKQKGYCSRKKGHSDERMKEPTRLASEKYIYSDEERNSWQPRKRNNEDLFEKDDNDFVLERRYREEFVQVNYRRPVPYCGREREHSQEKCYRLAQQQRREMKSSDRRERYWDRPHFDLLNDSFRSAVHDDQYCGHYNHETLPSHFCRESPMSNGREWRDRTSLKSDAYDLRRLDQRDVDHWRRIHSLKHRNNYLFDRSSRDDCNADYLDNEKRYFGQSTAFDWSQGELSSRGRGRVDHEESPYGSSRYKSVLVKRETSHDGAFFDDDQLEQDRKRMITEESRYSQVSNRISSSFGMIETNAPAALRCRDSIEQHLIDWEGKSSGRLSKAGDARCNGRSEKTNFSFDKERRTGRCFDESYSWKAVPFCSSKGEDNTLHGIRSKVEIVGESEPEHFTDPSNKTSPDKSRVNQLDETSVLEEGKLEIEPERETGTCPETNWLSEKTSQAGVTKEKIANSEDASEIKTGGYDNNRILETLAKMERRRERFKEPIALKKETDNNPKPEVDVVDTSEIKQQRPTRKRRWGGS